MAHLIQDGIVVNDHTWKLGIFVTDLNTSKDIFVRGDTSLGSLMMSLVNEIRKFCTFFYQFIFRRRTRLEVEIYKFTSFYAIRISILINFLVIMRCGGPKGLRLKLYFLNDF